MTVAKSMRKRWQVATTCLQQAIPQPANQPTERVKQLKP
jgi:hypothetical protein